ALVLEPAPGLAILGFITSPIYTPSREPQLEGTKKAHLDPEGQNAPHIRATHAGQTPIRASGFLSLCKLYISLRASMRRKGILRRLACHFDEILQFRSQLNVKLWPLGCLD